MSYFGFVAGLIVLIFMISPDALGDQAARVIHAYNQKLLELTQEQPK